MVVLCRLTIFQDVSFKQELVLDMDLVLSLFLGSHFSEDIRHDDSPVWSRVFQCHGTNWKNMSSMAHQGGVATAGYQTCIFGKQCWKLAKKKKKTKMNYQSAGVQNFKVMFMFISCSCLRLLPHNTTNAIRFFCGFFHDVWHTTPHNKNRKVAPADNLHAPLTWSLRVSFRSNYSKSIAIRSIESW